MLATEPETVKDEVESGVLDTVVNETMTNDLTVIERAKFENLDIVVVDGREAFIRVGNALAQIRDGRLYRATHGTFEAYLGDRGYGRQRAYALIEAAEVATSVSEISDIPVKTESHAAALAEVPAEDRGEVLKAAAEATGGKITAKAIKRASRRKPVEPVEVEEVVEVETSSEQENIASGSRWAAASGEALRRYKAQAFGFALGTMLDDLERGHLAVSKLRATSVLSLLNSYGIKAKSWEPKVKK